MASSLQAHQHATHLLEVVHILVKLVGSDSYQANPAAQVEKLQAMLHVGVGDIDGVRRLPHTSVAFNSTEQFIAALRCTVVHSPRLPSGPPAG